MAIDIIVPVYNSETFLRECIESIIAQSHRDWKLFLIDDGSTDNSGKICDTFAESDARISVLHQKNSGVSAARNNGISASDSEFICFVDSDDMLKPNALETMLDDLILNNADAAFFNAEELYDDRRLKKRPRLTCGTYSFEDIKNILVDDGTLTGILFGSACFAIYRRSIIKENNISFNREITKNEDGIFNINYISLCSSIFYDGEKYLYLYRQWKTLPHNKPLSVNPVWEKTNSAIGQIYDNCGCNDAFFETQMKRRNISIAFWNIYAIKNSKKGVFECSRFIKTVLNKYTDKSNYKYLNKHMPKAKRIIIVLMKFKMCFCLSLIIKILIPILRKE